MSTTQNVSVRCAECGAGFSMAVHAGVEWKTWMHECEDGMRRTLLVSATKIEQDQETAIRELTQRVRHPWIYNLRHPLQFIERKINQSVARLGNAQEARTWTREAL